MPGSGMRRDSRGHGGPVRMKIELLDADNRPIFIWHPTSTRLALGIRKALEVAIDKMGIDPSEEGIILLKPSRNLDMDPDMLAGAMHAGLIIL